MKLPEDEDEMREVVAKAVFIGALLWTVHARSRFADMARIIDEPELDLCWQGLRRVQGTLRQAKDLLQSQLLGPHIH